MIKCKNCETHIDEENALCAHCGLDNNDCQGRNLVNGRKLISGFLKTSLLRILVISLIFPVFPVMFGWVNIERFFIHTIIFCFIYAPAVIQKSLVRFVLIVIINGLISFLMVMSYYESNMKPNDGLGIGYLLFITVPFILHGVLGLIFVTIPYLKERVKLRSQHYIN